MRRAKVTECCRCLHVSAKEVAGIRRRVNWREWLRAKSRRKGGVAHTVGKAMLNVERGMTKIIGYRRRLVLSAQRSITMSNAEVRDIP